MKSNSFLKQTTRTEQPNSTFICTKPNHVEFLNKLHTNNLFMVDYRTHYVKSVQYKHKIAIQILVYPFSMIY